MWDDIDHILHLLIAVAENTPQTDDFLQQIAGVSTIIGAGIESSDCVADECTY